MRLDLEKGTHGGRRTGSGRRRLHSQGVAHRPREKLNKRTPLHVNFKFRTMIKNKQSLRLLKRAIVNARRMGLRVLHFSLQSNHIHVILEADNNEILTRGMRSLTITFAKGLSMGKIQVERYHLHVLRSVKEAKHAIAYVLFNKQKHEKGTYSEIDEYSSLLNLKNGLSIIRNFAKKRKMVLKILRNEIWEADRPQSYFARAFSSHSSE